MGQDALPGIHISKPSTAWWRDAITLVLVWMRAFVRLGSVIAFSVGVAALLLVKSAMRAFGHPS